MTEPKSVLTNRETILCEYGGSFGVLLALTCLVQHLILMISSTTPNLMIFAYIFTCIAFLSLALQKFWSIVLLIVSALLSLLIEYLWIIHYIFSFVVLLLFVYHVVIVVTLFM